MRKPRSAPCGNAVRENSQLNLSNNHVKQKGMAPMVWLVQFTLGKYSPFSSGWEAGNGQTAIDVFVRGEQSDLQHVLYKSLTGPMSYVCESGHLTPSDFLTSFDILSIWSLKPKTSQGVTPTLSPKHLDTGRSTPMPVTPQLAVPRWSKRFPFCGPALVQSDGWITQG